MGEALLLLRWSWRDLRRRWPQVVAIALVIALGTGSFAGLSSVTEWRRVSTNDAYQQLAMYDLRITLAEGAELPRGALSEQLTSPGDSPVARVDERLLLDVQVDASRGETAILVPGQLYGLELEADGPEVNRLYAEEGRILNETDIGEPVVALEANFAGHHELPPEGTITLTGGRELQYVGHVLTPEYFIVTTERGGLLAEASFAAVFTSLETAQSLSGRGDVVNDAVVVLEPGADLPAAQEWLETLVADEFPGVGATVGTRDDDPAFRLNDRDIEGDQKLYEIFAVLIFGGAMVAAFNLVARLVESQRREIGVAMAIGASPARIALRPLLVGAEIAFLGAILGVVVGIVIGTAMSGAVRSLMPLPNWDTSFQVDVFLRVGLIGFLLPFIATAWPIWRAVSVDPISAIRPSYRNTRGPRWLVGARRFSLPGNTFARLPIRNVVRTPQRSLLTVVGIAAAIAALIAFVGMLDSFVEAIDVGRDEIEGDTPARLDVTMDRPYPVDAPAIAAVSDAETIGQVQPFLRIGATAANGETTLDLQLDVLPLENAIWSPTIDRRPAGESPGIYLSERAASDLGVSEGDAVTIRYPAFAPDGSVATQQTELLVHGTHPHPFRFIAYVDSVHAASLGLAGIANQVMALPAASATADDARRELFTIEGVGYVEGVSELAQALSDLLNEFIVVLRVVEGALLLLALLIAFNLASINVDERSRDHATMFAFGVPVSTVVRMGVVENFILGVISTAIGVLAGWWLLGYLLSTRVRDTMPDIAIPAHIEPLTLTIAVGLGVLAVALAPLLTIRRLRRMNIPGALKVFE